MELNKSLLALMAVLGMTAAAEAQSPNEGLGITSDGTAVPAEDLELYCWMLSALLGVTGDEAEQGIIAILIGYRAGEIDGAQAVDRLNDIAANDNWLSEIAARVQVAQALRGDLGPNRAAILAELVTRGDPARALLFANADVEALVAAFDRGALNVVGAIDRISRFGGTEPFPFALDEAGALSDDSVNQGVFDVIAGGAGNDRVRPADVGAAVESMGLDIGLPAALRETGAN